MSISEFYNKLSYEMRELEKTVLANTAETFKKLEPANIHECFYIYCYLLFNGYFSKEKYHEYCDIDGFEEADHLTFNNYYIYSGKGVCRHNSNLLNKILNELKIDSRYLEIKLDNIKWQKLIDIKRNVGNLPPNTFCGTYNHAVVFVKTANSNYILDSTNICELEIIGDKEIYFPNGEYILDEGLLRKDLPNIEYKHESTISKQLLLEYYRRMKKKCIENQKLLDSLYNENKESYKEISKKLEYFKI